MTNQKDTMHKTAHEIVKDALNEAIRIIMIYDREDSSERGFWPYVPDYETIKDQTDALALLETTHAVVPREMTDDLAEKIADMANCCGGVRTESIHRIVIAAATEGEKK